MSRIIALVSVFLVLVVAVSQGFQLHNNRVRSSFRAAVTVTGPLATRMAVLDYSASAAAAPQSTAGAGFQPLVDMSGIQLSTLQGKALEERNLPTLAEVKAALPPHIWEKSDTKSLSYAALDVVAASIPVALAVKYLLPTIQSPTPLSILGWLAYAVIGGTIGIGAWVTAHECGHGAFSNNRKLQDFVGYLFHSILLVPYYSWQRSHAVHHANTNHIEDGETHVPPVASTMGNLLSGPGVTGKQIMTNILGKTIGGNLYGLNQLLAHLGVGWPAYLLAGVTGGPSRGKTNHFIPGFSIGLKNPDKELFPKRMANKVWASDVGIAAMLGVLGFMVKKLGFWATAGLYGGPLVVINAWLVAYTWLQHTEVDVPHLPAKDFSFIKGAFLTIDRPYEKLLGGVIDFLHHKIGSTHVVHHIDSTIPHYNAAEATKIIKEKFPQCYLHESTPVFSALWRVSRDCHHVTPRPTSNGSGDLYVFANN